MSRINKQPFWARARAFPLTILALLIVSLVAVFFVSRLGIDNSPEVYLPADVPTVVLDKALREDFPHDQVLVVLFSAAELYEKRFLTRFDELVVALERNPEVERVVAVTTADHISGTEGDFVVEPLLDVELYEDFGVEGVRGRLMGDRFAPGITVAIDGSAMSLVVRPADLRGSLQRYAFIEMVRAEVAAAELTEYAQAYAGQIALDVAQLQAMIRDSLMFVPMTTTVGAVLMWVMFRRPLTVVLAVSAIGLMSLFAVAIVAAWGRPYTLVTSIIPPFMAALTTAALVHVFSALRYASARGLDGRARIERALAMIRRPVFYTCVTTAVGLFSLVVNPILPIQTFGVAAGLGVLMLYPLLIWLLPPLLLRWDRAKWPNRINAVHGVRHVVRAVARFSMRRAGWVLFVFGLSLTVLLPQIAKVHSETDLYRFFAPAHELNVSTRLVEEKLSGVTTLEVVFDAPEVDDLKEPSRLEALNLFQAWLDAQSEVDRTFCMADVIEEMHWAFHGEHDDFRSIPDDKLLISQYLFIYGGQDLYELVDDRFQRTRLTVNLSVSGSQAIEAVVDRIEQRLEQVPVADLKPQVVGFGRLFVDQNELLVQGQVYSLIAVLVLVTLVLIGLMRSVRDGLVCMIPNMSPIVLIFILMGMFGIWLDMATAMIAGVAVGIAVDDTIHLYYAQKRRREHGASVVYALMRAYQQVGGALVVTTLLLVSQMLLLGLSGFMPTAQFGLLTAFGLVVALVFDLMLLPALLVMMGRLRQRA